MGENLEITSKDYLSLSIEVYQNIFPCKIKLLTTSKTKEQVIGGRFLPDYPIVIPNYPESDSYFRDSIVPHNSVLDAIGGDYRVVSYNSNII